MLSYQICHFNPPLHCQNRFCNHSLPLHPQPNHRYIFNCIHFLNHFYFIFNFPVFQSLILGLKIYGIYCSKNLTCFCERVVSKIHLSTLILTCLWTSKGVLTKSLWSGWKFGPNSTEYPPPRKLKFRHILALCDFSVSEYPPPPTKI